MARPLRIEYQGAFYHITSRGNERKHIYKDAEDRKKFLSYLESATERYRAVFHAYCLMNNHYHLLLETPEGNLSQIMRHVNGSYTTYFNIKRDRAGHLFQGRYKAILVEADEYAGELSRYIHLNPVRAHIAQKPEHYQWSSYRYYIGTEKPPEWFTIGFILGYFGKELKEGQKNYREFIRSAIGKSYENPLKETIAASILGGRDFVEEIKEKYLKGKPADRDLPSLTELMRGPELVEISNMTESILGKGTALAKKAGIYVSHAHSRRTLKEIGIYYGIGESGVTQASRRFRTLLKTDRVIRKKIEAICQKLKM